MTAPEKNFHQTNIHVHSEQEKHLEMVNNSLKVETEDTSPSSVFIVNFEQILKFSYIFIVEFHYVIVTKYFKVLNLLTTNFVNLKQILDLDLFFDSAPFFPFCFTTA